MTNQPFEVELVSARQCLAELELHFAELPAQHRAVVTQGLEAFSTAMEKLQVAGEQLHAQNEQLLASAKELETAHQRYHDLFEFAPDGYVITNPEGIIREANRAAGELLAVAPLLLIDQPLVSFVATEDRKA